MQYKDLIDAKVPYLSKLSPGGSIPHNMAMALKQH